MVQDPFSPFHPDGNSLTINREIFIQMLSCTWQALQTTTPGTTRPTLYDKCVGSLTSPANQSNEDAGDGAYGLSSLSEKRQRRMKSLFYCCLTRTGNYRIHKFDWLKLILTAV